MSAQVIGALGTNAHRLKSCTKCNLNPSFGFEGEGAHRCAKHTLPGMVNVNSTRCNYPECTRNASFGFAGCRIMRCKTHADDGMVHDTLRRRTPPKYVRRCKLPNAHQCETPECYRMANYGSRKDGKVRQCKLHKELGMFNLCVRRCDAEGCEKFPSWGYEGHKVTRCRAHAAPDMKDRKKRCVSCVKIATWGFPESPPEWCRQHAKEGTQNVVSPRCGVEDCQKFAVIKKNGGVCREHSLE